jgi:hypothetical protein
MRIPDAHCHAGNVVLHHIRCSSRVRHDHHTRSGAMKAFFLFSLFWLIAWAIFLLTALCDRNGNRLHSRTLLDDIDVEL